MSENKLKVLVINPSIDNLAKCVKVVNSQNKKAGPFEFALFLGDVCSKDQKDELDSLKPDIPIYFAQGEHEYVGKIDDNGNWNYLGDFGVYKLANGLKIGYVSGDLNKYDAQTIHDRFKDQKLDIFLTYLWPDAIAKEERLLLSADTRLDSLINATKPQYWFACGGDKGRYFERDPYSIDGRVTKFISLAEIGTDRYWYAFQIGLNPEVVTDVVGNAPVVESAKSSLPKRPLIDANSESSVKRQNGATAAPLIISPDSCFLCLSNPRFELHMVIAVAQSCFLSVTKGPLTLKNEHEFSGHGMIVPIDHYPTLRAGSQSRNPEGKVEDDDVYKEVNKIQLSLVEMFRSLGDTSVVFWEISRKRSFHAHLQFVPVADSLIGRFQETLDAQIEFTTKPNSEPLEYKRFTEADDSTELYETINTEDYVLFTVYEKDVVTKYLVKLGNDDDKFFDAQFPRKVLAVLLDLKNRIHWSKCKTSRDDESAEKAAFKQKYRDFDIMRKSK